MSKTTSPTTAGAQSAFVETDQPVASLPNIYIGFAFALVLLLVEVSEVGAKNFGATLFKHALLYSGAFYWLFSIHRVHVVLRQLDPAYPISPEAAVAWHFPPFYSLYWIFKWPIELSRFIRDRGAGIIEGNWLGLAIFSSIILGQIYWGLGMAGFFTVCFYILRKLKLLLVYDAVPLPEPAELALGRIVGGLLLGNLANYIVANTFFVTLLAFPAIATQSGIKLALLTVLFPVSGFFAGLVAGAVGRVGGLVIGSLSNSAVVGSIIIGLFLSRENNAVPVKENLPAFLGLAVLALLIGTAGSKIGAAAYPGRRRYYVPAQAPPAELEGDTIAGLGSANWVRRAQGVAVGNFSSLVILLIYRYPAAFIEYLWEADSYLINRTANGLVLMTAAYVAAYLAVLIGRRDWPVTGLAANSIIYLFMLVFLISEGMAGRLWTYLIGTTPFFMAVTGAAFLGAKMAYEPAQNAG